MALGSSIVKCLIQNNADVNKPSYLGVLITPLFISSQNGYLQAVKYLVQNGAKVNQHIDDGRTPLMVSCFNGHLSIVKYLVENGADIYQATQIGITSLAFAILNNQTEIAKFLLRNDVDTENTILGLKKYGELELIEILDKLNKIMKE